MPGMGALSGRDRGSLLDAVDAIAQTTDLPELRQVTTVVVGNLISTNLAAWNEVDPGGRTDVVMTPDIPRWEGGAEAFENNIGEHPLISYFQRTGDGRPYAISDFLTPAQFHATALYQQFYRRIDAEDQLAFIVPETQRIIGIALNRDRRGFSERDHTVANLFRPHLAHAYTNAKAHERVKLLTTALDGVAESRNEGVIVLDEYERPEHTSPGSARLLARWFPDHSGHLLPAAIQEWIPTSASRFPLIVEDAHQRLTIRLLTGTDRSDRTLLITEDSDTDEQRLLQRLGLTPRQSEVIALAAHGLTNATIAEQLWISARTVEGHISEGLHRLGVETRTAAAHLLHQAT
jgi:DNA-binding CsgD family transcriptional regulator